MYPLIYFAMILCICTFGIELTLWLHRRSHPPDSHLLELLASWNQPSSHWAGWRWRTYTHTSAIVCFFDFFLRLKTRPYSTSGSSSSSWLPSESLMDCPSLAICLMAISAVCRATSSAMRAISIRSCSRLQRSRTWRPDSSPAKITRFCFWILPLLHRGQSHVLRLPLDALDERRPAARLGLGVLLWHFGHALWCLRLGRSVIVLLAVCRLGWRRSQWCRCWFGLVFLLLLPLIVRVYVFQDHVWF